MAKTRIVAEPSYAVFDAPANMRPAHAACNLAKGATWEGAEANG